MRSVLLVLILAFACVGVGAPPPAIDVRHADDVVRYRIHRWVLPRPPSDAERHRLLRDLAAACTELCGERAEPTFRFLVAVGWKESSMTWDWHDGGIGWGPWALQDYEVSGAARRLGKPTKGAWERFLHDRTFAVWISVEHFRWLLVTYGWAPRRAALVHNAGVQGAEDWRKRQKYVPDLVDCYERAWDSHLAFDFKGNEGDFGREEVQGLRTRKADHGVP